MAAGEEDYQYFSKDNQDGGAWVVLCPEGTFVGGSWYNVDDFGDHVWECNRSRVDRGTYRKEPAGRIKLQFTHVFGSDCGCGCGETHEEKCLWQEMVAPKDTVQVQLFDGGKVLHGYPRADFYQVLPELPKGSDEQKTANFLSFPGMISLAVTQLPENSSGLHKDDWRVFVLKYALQCGWVSLVGKILKHAMQVGPKIPVNTSGLLFAATTDLTRHRDPQKLAELRAGAVSLLLDPSLVDSFSEKPDVNFVPPKQAGPPLFPAVRSANLSVVKALLKFGADASKTGTSQQSSLCFLRYPTAGKKMAEELFLEIVQLLLAGGADPLLPDYRTPTGEYCALEEAFGHLAVDTPSEAISTAFQLFLKATRVMERLRGPSGGRYIAALVKRILGKSVNTKAAAIIVDLVENHSCNVNIDDDIPMDAKTYPSLQSHVLCYLAQRRASWTAPELEPAALLVALKSAGASFEQARHRLNPEWQNLDKHLVDVEVLFETI